MLEYRGYGLSKGSPSEEGLYMDARSAIDFLSSRQDVNHKQIIVFGRSLGKLYLFDTFVLLINKLSENTVLCICVHLKERKLYHQLLIKY